LEIKWYMMAMRMNILIENHTCIKGNIERHRELPVVQRMVYGQKKPVVVSDNYGK